LPLPPSAPEQQLELGGVAMLSGAWPAARQLAHALTPALPQ
jgi:hypothetical protein